MDFYKNFRKYTSSSITPVNLFKRTENSLFDTYNFKDFKDFKDFSNLGNINFNNMDNFSNLKEFSISPYNLNSRIDYIVITNNQKNSFRSKSIVDILPINRKNRGFMMETDNISSINIVNVEDSSKIIKDLNSFFLFPQNKHIGNNFILHLKNNEKYHVENGKIYIPGKGNLIISSIDLVFSVIYF
jgi:hypothetical protein